MMRHFVEAVQKNYDEETIQENKQQRVEHRAQMMEYCIWPTWKPGARGTGTRPHRSTGASPTSSQMLEEPPRRG